jgi:hypothetical protein
MRRLVVLAACCVATLGCAVEQLHHDQDKIRTALLDLYTNQIVDNLIRTANKMPIIEVDYTNAAAQLTAHENGAFTDSPYQVTNSHAATVVAATTMMATHTLLNTIGGSLTGDLTNQVQVTANPVTTTAAAYDAYQRFVSIPGSLRVTCDPPPEGAAHLCKRCGKEYYWVPVEFKRQFLELALAAITDRAAALPAPDPFYSVNIIKVISEAPVRSGVGVAVSGKYLIELQTDQKIPNDLGRVVVGTAGYAFSVYDSGAGHTPPETDRLVITYDETPPNTPKASTFIAGIPVAAKIYLRNHRPTRPVVGGDLKMIEFQLQQIQFNQLRNNL